MCELGERLRRAREERGLSLKEAAERLSLKVGVLEALEACRFAELPEPALARGYLRRYARLLGLDPEPLLALYPKAPTLEPPPPPSAGGGLGPCGSFSFWALGLWAMGLTSS
ncbi:helix-turn-helix domain-containing protein [Thermus brockianus]|uniref:helix-turn-helix domain-containing protein n=1 Tax=Thermus brockianus TaxID=56956 RepID=UPI000AB828B6|nr:helix-turn-helix transcriptional regulator [Thermus brockianus]